MSRHYIKDDKIIKTVADGFYETEPAPADYDSYEDTAFGLNDRVKVEGGSVVADAAFVGNDFVADVQAGAPAQ